MSLYQCSQCGVKENTATSGGGYLARLIAPDELREKGLDESGKYCSECFTGKWHEIFPKEYFPIGSMETDSVGNLRKCGASGKEGICIHCRDGKHSSCCLVLCSCNCGGASGKGEE